MLQRLTIPWLPGKDPSQPRTRKESRAKPRRQSWRLLVKQPPSRQQFPLQYPPQVIPVSWAHVEKFLHYDPSKSTNKLAWMHCQNPSCSSSRNNILLPSANHQSASVFSSSVGIGKLALHHLLIILHTAAVKSQPTNRWWQSSSWRWQSGQMSSWGQFRLARLSAVRHRSFSAIHMKKRTCEGALECHSSSP